LEKFYLRSYGRIIGEASNLNELKREMRRLSISYQAALEYHLMEGHISQWLEYIGETALAKELGKTRTVPQAQNVIDKYVENKMIIERMTRGRMH